MVPKSLVFGLLVGSCVVAAGGGAYIATLQQARSTAAAASLRNAETADRQAQQVASTLPSSPMPAVAGPETEAPAPVVVPELTRPAGASRPVPKKPDVKVPSSGEPAMETPAPAVRAPEPSSPNQNSGPVSIQGNPTPQADPVPAPQRPWPGPPAASSTVPPVSSGAEPGRADAENPSGDKVKLWEELVVPAESVLGLQLESTLSTEQARVEDRVEARVTRDVRVGGRAAIPAGSHVLGSVMLVERGGKMKDRARIGLRFHTLLLTDGTKMPITTDTVYRESDSPGNKTSAKIGGAAIGGAIIGAIIGGGKGAAIGSGIGAAGGTAAAMTSDRMTVVMPAGTNLSVRTLAPISVTVEK